MTITVQRLGAPVGPTGREFFEVEGEWTARQVLEHYRHPGAPAAAPLAVLLNGGRLSDEELDQPLEDGADVVIAPDLQGLEAALVTFLNSLLVSLAVGAVFAAVSYAYYRTKDGGGSQPDLDDESSPTYLLDGVSTRRGPGFPIPVVYGEHRCGGQVLASRADETVYVPRGQTNEIRVEDWLHLLIAYSEGPIHRIGDVDAGVCGELNDLGFRIGELLYGNSGLPRKNLPDGLKINGTLIEPDPDQTIALAHLRMGTLHQSPVRGPIRQASTLYNVDEELTKGNPVIYETIDDIDSLELKLQFPAGLYSLNGSAMQPYRVDFLIKFRVVGDTTPWDQIAGWGTNVQFPVGTRAAVSKTLRWSAWTRGRYQIHVERVTDDDNQSSTSSPSSRCFWRSSTEVTENDFAYPMLALMGLSLAGSERVSGTISTITIPVKGRVLSRYDGSQWVDEEWEDGSGNTTAKNPAWILADLLTNSRYGAGRLISRGQLDADSFKALADYCDELVDDGDGKTEPRHQFDGVFDAQSSVWDAVQRVARSCRAAVMLWGNQVRVAFDHTRSRVRLFSSSVITDFSMSYIDKTQVPTVYDVRIANAERDWDQDTIPQEDPDADLDPYSLNVDTRRRKQIELYGVTRPSHARREAIYLFRKARYRDRIVSFTVPLEGMGLEVFDRVAVEHWLPRWHSSSASAGNIENPDTFGYRATNTGEGGTSVTLDQAVTFEPGKTYQLLIRTSDGTPSAVLTVSSPAGDYAAGASISFTGDTPDWNSGAQVAIGEASKVVEDIIVTRIEFLDGLVARITGETYDERVYDIPSSYNPQEVGLGGELAPQGGTGSIETIPDAEDLAVHRTDRPGAIELQWSWPAGYRERAHCFVRTSDTGWRLFSDTDHNLATVAGLDVGKSYTFSVALRDRTGTYQSPAEAAQLSVELEEFEALPPPNIVRISASQRERGYLVSWAAVHGAALDYYELRRGPQWHGAELIGRTRDTQLLIDDAPYGTQKVWIRARSRNGLYSPVPVGGSLLGLPPEGTAISGADIDIADGDLTGTADGCELNADDELEMSAGEHTATYTSASLDAGSVAYRWWSVLVDQLLDEDWTVDEISFDVDSGEAHWWNVDGREATYGKPGVDFDWDVDDATGAIETLKELVSGPVGFAGPHTRGIVDARFDTTGSGDWTAWRRFRTGYVTAQRMQVRLTIQRESDRYSPRVSNLYLAVAS